MTNRQRVKALEGRLAQLEMTVYLLQAALADERAVNAEYRQALYPAYRLGYPIGERLAEVLRKAEDLPA